MSDIAIRIENLSKQYRLGTVGSGTLSHDLNRWWHRMRGKEDPYLKIGETNDRSHRGASEYVWALRDINLEMKQGEVMGIIGKNGAGKSTLLKILSKVTSPTFGCIMAKGRIASLLEVGTGFHPELTGRENIYLNGAILGMTKQEVSRKLDEIVDFAGMERYLDTPVKRYSTGMTVRLGFAVAAFLEEEILLVDEVLAVGDAEFQKKAVGKMQEVSSGEGRTVLFVSHNMAAVQSLCTRAILLINGELKDEGNPVEVINKYLSAIQPLKNIANLPSREDLPFQIKSIVVKAKDKGLSDPITMEDPVEITIDTERKIENEISYNLTLQFKDEGGNVLFSSGTGSNLKNPDSTIYSEGRHEYCLFIPGNFFNQGNFSINVSVIENHRVKIFSEGDVIFFTITPKAIEQDRWLGKSKGALKPNFEWEHRLEFNNYISD